jgi:DNA transposition AAA+ family ATPase
MRKSAKNNARGIKMHTEDQKTLLQKFDELAAKLGSQNKACNQIGITAPVISALRNESYKGNVNDQFAKLEGYFKAKEEAAALPSAGSANRNFVPTSISTDVYSVIHNCRLQGGLAVACGKAGIGKTMGARRYIQDNPHDTIYIALNPCITTLRSLLRILCDRLSVSARTIDEMWIGVANKLRDGMVIIIDEAQHCPIRSLEMLRAFSDHFAEAGQTLGIALIGNAITISSWDGNKKAEYAQISSRMRQNRVYNTNAVTLDDIKILFPDLATHNRDQELELMLQVARDPQAAVRGAVNLYNNAIDNGDATYKGLVAMYKHMFGVLPRREG